MFIFSPETIICGFVLLNQCAACPHTGACVYNSSPSPFFQWLMPHVAPLSPKESSKKERKKKIKNHLLWTEQKWNAFSFFHPPFSGFALSFVKHLTFRPVIPDQKPARYSCSLVNFCSCSRCFTHGTCMAEIECTDFPQGSTIFRDVSNGPMANGPLCTRALPPGTDMNPHVPLQWPPVRSAPPPLCRFTSDIPAR